MQYLMMCCINEQQWDELPKSQRERIMREYGEWVQVLTRTGQYLSGAKLRGTASATTVRASEGKPIIVDGPFAETKEQLGGYHLVECNDLDEALSIAKQIPTIPYGGTVEVRPLLT
jgi:hypothetical protein